jgi:hypothetical protein
MRYGIGKCRSSFLEGSLKVTRFMPVHEILLEAGKLRKVSDSLNVLSTQYAPLAEALSILSGNVRNSASLLEVLVELRLGPEPGFEGASN